MASSTEPRSGLVYGWAYGESGWKTGMDNNLLSLGRFAYHLSVKDRDLTTPPGSPVAGDTYIVGPAATGAWASKDGQVTIWDGAAWVFGIPRLGWIAYVEDETVITVYTTSWSTGIKLSEIADANQAATAMNNAVSEISGLPIGATYNQTEIQNLRTKCEELAGDVRALHTLVHALRTALISTGQIKGSA